MIKETKKEKVESKTIIKLVKFFCKLVFREKIDYSDIGNLL